MFNLTKCFVMAAALSFPTILHSAESYGRIVENDWVVVQGENACAAVKNFKNDVQFIVSRNWKSSSVRLSMMRPIPVNLISEGKSIVPVRYIVSGSGLNNSNYLGNADVSFEKIEGDSDRKNYVLSIKIDSRLVPELYADFSVANEFTFEPYEVIASREIAGSFSLKGSHSALKEMILCSVKSSENSKENPF